MKGRKGLIVCMVTVLVLSALLAGCGNEPAASSTPVSGQMDKLTLQLKWLDQAQFAGFYVAAEKGYYKEQNLDVTILPGGPDVVPSQKVLTGAADVGVDWVGSLLANRDKGQPIVDIFQHYQTSGLYLISKKKAGINSPKDLKGKKVGVWTGGNEFEFRALMDKYGYDNSIDNNRDMTIIKQGFEMDTFLNDQLDAASAMIYNEYHVVLEAGVKPEELNVINYNDEGVGMLEDHLFATEDTIRNKRDALIRFLAASQKGWIDAVKDPNGAVDAVMKRVDAATTNREHQVTMMQEVAKLVMPAGLDESKVGFIDEAKFKTTADIALKFNVISKPAENAYTNELVEEAVKIKK